MTQEEALAEAAVILNDYRDSIIGKPMAEESLLKLLDEVGVTPPSPMILTKEEREIVNAQCRYCDEWDGSKGCMTGDGTCPEPTKGCLVHRGQLAPTLDPKDQSAVQAESQLMLTLRHLQSMILISYWKGERICGQEYDYYDCTHCSHCHFCTQDNSVSQLIPKMESQGV